MFIPLKYILPNTSLSIIYQAPQTASPLIIEGLLCHSKTGNFICRLIDIKRAISLELTIFKAQFIFRFLPSKNEDFFYSTRTWYRYFSIFDKVPPDL
jgi:hypothetical protein